MTKKQIILCLLPIYKRAIHYVEQASNIEIAKHTLILFSVEVGICSTSNHKLNEFIGDKKWVNRHNSYKDGRMDYWAKPPSDGTTIEEILYLLQIRVGIMEKELKRKWWQIF